MAPNRSKVPSFTARRGISPDAFHCALWKVALRLTSDLTVGFMVALPRMLLRK